jgi:hypothetical protein
MKSYNTAYYLLAVLLIMGAFASMAQNDYGMTILSGVSLVFAILFLIQFIRQLRSSIKNDQSDPLEFLVLFFLASVFFLRTFQLFIPFMEGIFGAAGIFLALIYLRKTTRNFYHLRSKNKTLSILVLISYLSVVLFSVAMVMLVTAPRSARWVGACAICMALFFLVTALFRTPFIIEGKKSTVISTIVLYKDRYILLLSLFLIFSLYIGLTGAGVLPRLYSDNYPQPYYHLINQAESGKEKPVDGQYKYEVFKKMYDEFENKNLKIK